VPEATLPAFVEPMLARLSREPFDSDAHLFEVKWDGYRGLCFRDRDRHRLTSRNRTDFVPRFPELSFLAGLPPGLVIDGEIVRLVEGLPEFQALQERNQARPGPRLEALAREAPVTYVVFDLLFEGFADLRDLPLSERRARLERLVREHPHPRWAISEGVRGTGKAFFAAVRGRDIEGMVAKRLDSRYESGRRSGAWVKVKAPRTALCLVLGWVPDETGDLKSLVVGAPDDRGALACVGRVGSGLTESLRRTLRDELVASESHEPLVPCPGVVARWTEPRLYCRVEYLEKTRDGTLRAPVFVGLVNP
jgi:DNA ligase D-like protein (predicted ligase)